MKDKYSISIQTYYSANWLGDIFTCYGTSREEVERIAMREIEEITWDSPHFTKIILKIEKLNQSKVKNFQAGDIKYGRKDM